MQTQCQSIPQISMVTMYHDRAIEINMDLLLGEYSLCSEAAIQVRELVIEFLNQIKGISI